MNEKKVSKKNKALVSERSLATVSPLQLYLREISKYPLLKPEEELELAKGELEVAKREGNLSKAGEISYSIIPGLEKKLSCSLSENDGNALVAEAVLSEHIAAVVEKWTGIPVSKMLESETEKLLHMEDHLRRRVVGQDPALESVSNAIRRARVEISDPNP